MSMKNSNDTIGNRTRDLPVRSSVPQPSYRVPQLNKITLIILITEPRNVLRGYMNDTSMSAQMLNYLLLSVVVDKKCKCV